MRILIADDKEQVRFALRVLLAQQPGLQIVGEASDSRGLLEQTRIASPSLVLLDWELPGLVESGGIPALQRSGGALLVIVLSSRIGVRRAVLAAGANAFVSKSDPPERLLEVISRCSTLDP